MEFKLPPLPYQPDALAPVISLETVDYHWGKHEKNYIDTINKLKKGTDYEQMTLEEIVQNSDGKIFNNASQAWNHMFYFFQFNPNPESTEPHGALRKNIEEQFGSFENFKEKFEEAGTTLFGSGWVWLASDEDGRLSIITGPNAYNPMKDDLKPIMVFDVWEHAYYLDYQNRRADYLHSLWRLVDWDVVEVRYM